MYTDVYTNNYRQSESLFAPNLELEYCTTVAGLAYLACAGSVTPPFSEITKQISYSDIEVALSSPTTTISPSPSSIDWYWNEDKYAAIVQQK